MITRIKKTLMTLAIGASIMLNVVLFGELARLESNNSSLWTEIATLKEENLVFKRTSFSIGCIVAVREQLGIRADDPMIDTYALWCTNMGKSYSED